MRTICFFILLLGSLPILVQGQDLDQLSLQELDSIGRKYYSKRDYANTLKYLKKIIEKTPSTSKHIDSILQKKYYTTGMCHYYLGQLDSTETYWFKAKQCAARYYGTKHVEYSICLSAIGILYRDMDRHEEAKPFYLQSTSIKRRTLGEEHPEYAGSLVNLGILSISLKDPKSAEKYYKEAYDILRKYPEHPFYTNVLMNLGALHFSKGQYLEAEPLISQGLEKIGAREGKKHPLYAQTLSNLAAIYTKTNRFEMAKRNTIEALEIYGKTHGQQHEVYLTRLINLAHIYIDNKDYSNAKKQLEASIIINSKGSDTTILDNFSNIETYDFHSYAALNLTLLAFHKIAQNIFHEQGDSSALLEGYLYLEAAMKNNKRLRNEFNDDKDKLRVLGEMHELVYESLSTSLLLSQFDNSINYKEKAFEYIEQNKSVLLAEATKADLARSFGDLPDSLATREAALQEQKSDLKKQEVLAKDPLKLEAIREQQNQLNLEIKTFLASLKNKFPNYHARKYENITAKVEDIQSLLDPETLLIEYFVSDSATYLFSISQSELHFVPINIPKTELSGHIKTLRKALSDYRYILESKNKHWRSFSAEARWFYKTLLAPIEEQLQPIKKLIFIPDNELGHLPFEVFLAEDPPQKEGYKNLPYLINDFEISYNYSATLWKHNLSQPSNSATEKNHRMLACAANYSQFSDTFIKEKRGNHFGEMRNSLNPLPATEKEIHALSELFEGTFLTGDSTNEAYFKAHAKDYSIIHLAMHGLLHRRVPILSSLAFTENLDSLEDNFLQAYEIAHLQLNAELVVLSACETGFGKFEQGEGVMSMARSFMYAGAPSLVVSLWQVNDYSTALIMRYFYQELAKGKNKAAALRQAKLSFIEHADSQFSHPAFWSAFIQLGDSRPIVIKTKGGFPWVWIGLSGLLVLILGGFIWKRRAV